MTRPGLPIRLGVTALALLLCLGLPALLYTDLPARLSGGGPDAETHASLELPAQPSGEFVVLLNTARHGDTAAQWETFFSGGDGGVILSDLRCLTVAGDLAGAQLAARYQARLPENQMRLRQENGLLVASRAEAGRFDVIVLSRELAEAYALTGLGSREGTALIRVKGD